jgi:hypothetical protein
LNGQNCSFCNLNWINMRRSQKNRHAFLYSMFLHL